MAKFEIRRASPEQYLSRKFSSTGVRGLALGPHATEPESASVVDNGGTFLGFLTRRVTPAGPELQDHVFGHDHGGAWELPEKSGNEVTLCKATEIEVEGEIGNAGLLITSGTGALSGSTTIGTPCSFHSGKLRAAQSNDQFYYRVTAVIPDAEKDDSANVRLLFEAAEGRF